MLPWQNPSGHSTNPRGTGIVGEDPDGVLGGGSEEEPREARGRVSHIMGKE